MPNATPERLTTGRARARRSAVMPFAGVLLLVALAQPVLAQIPGFGGTKGDTAPGQEQVADPLERTTPRSTIGAFIRAVDRGDYVSAARYMQVTESQRRNADVLARDLKSLMDRYFSQAVTSISASPDGALDDGLAADRERVGPLVIGERRTDIVLVRVTDPQVGRIWLISSETLAQVPALHRSEPRTWIERVMPAPLVNQELLGISLAHWVVLAASLVIPFLLLVLVAGAVVRVARRIISDPSRRRDLDAWYAGLRRPVIAVLALAFHLSSIRYFGFPITFRLAYARLGLIVAVIALTWLLRRVLSLGFARARTLVWGKDRTSTQSLMLLAEKVINALVIIVAVVTILTIAGVNTKTALAGVGIGGVAIALGAQKSVENLLGGVFLLTDRALAVGDTCTISNRLGVVEDITLRSVRLRTLDQTLLSIPAGALAQDGIENFASREKILIQTTLRLKYGTTVDQLRSILGQIRQRLTDNPRIETSTARVRLVNFGERAVELELFAYVLTRDVPEFLKVREDVLLEVASIVEASGSGFAQPTAIVNVGDAPSAEALVRASPVREPVSREDVRLSPSIAASHADDAAIGRRGH